MSTLRFYQIVSDVDHEGETHRGFFLGVEDAVASANTLVRALPLGEIVIYRCTRPFESKFPAGRWTDMDWFVVESRNEACALALKGEG